MFFFTVVLQLSFDLGRGVLLFSRTLKTLNARKLMVLLRLMVH